jgi:signal transduction histidine kinase
MKLHSRYNRAIITATILVLLSASLAYYYLIRYTLISQVDRALIVEEQEITDYIHNQHQLPHATYYKDQKTEFVNVSTPQKRKFRSVGLLNKEEKEVEMNRQLLFPILLNGNHYTAIISKSQAETEDLIFLIVALTAAVILLLLGSLYITNRFLLRKLWQPFYNSLSAMKKFNLETSDKLEETRSDIEEFNDLNKALKEMTGKVQRDYASLKTFADNASHEMQTPLAIINSKLDLLIQDQQLNEKNMKHLEGIYDALDKLTKLNQSLLLMTRIENNQFAGKEPIQIDILIEKGLTQLEEFIQLKNLTLDVQLMPAIINMHPALADILINNLLVNAIRHNITSGVIRIQSTSNTIDISNTAGNHALDEKSVFNRFQKSNNSEGVGLGLAIVKQICNIYGFRIGYSYSRALHHFNIIF